MMLPSFLLPPATRGSPFEKFNSPHSLGSSPGYLPPRTPAPRVPICPTPFPVFPPPFNSLLCVLRHAFISNAYLIPAPQSDQIKEVHPKSFERTFTLLSLRSTLASAPASTNQTLVPPLFQRRGPPPRGSLRYEVVPLKFTHLPLSYFLPGPHANFWKNCGTRTGRLVRRNTAHFSSPLGFCFEGE